MKFVPMLAAVCFVLAGCAHNVPVIKESLTCALPADLVQNCVSPATIKTDVTYAEVLLLMQQDRANLRACGELYAGQITRAQLCEQGIAQHNAEIRKINASSKN